jgi:beta-glucosidase
VNTIRHRAVAAGVALSLLVAFLVLSATPSRAVDPTACPISSLSAAYGNLPWLSADYQGQFSTQQLAAQVVNCEEQFQPTTYVSAEIALTSLRFVTGTQWQKQNNWLALTNQKYRYIPDFNNLGIPSITLEDGPIGIRYQKAAANVLPTTFPNEITMASSMDTSVATEYGQQLGAEAAAMNYQGVQVPDLNILRVPTWGRASETFGENPLLTGILGRAELSAVLNQTTFAVVKHFGPYGQENSRRTLNYLSPVKTLYDNYLRPFALARAGLDSQLDANSNHDILTMCSFGDVNGAQSCTSTTLGQALSNFGYTGLVRSDLDVRAGLGSLYGAGVSLIKPQGALSISNANALSPTAKAALHLAAIRVVQEMFYTGLVKSGAVASLNDQGSVSPTLHNTGLAIANDVERRGAVLLKNSDSFFPLTPASTLFLAIRDLHDTCTALAASMKSRGFSSKCVTVKPALTNAAHPFNDLSASPKNITSVNGSFSAPSSGTYLIQDQTQGNSELYLNGNLVLNVDGTTEFPYPNYTTVTLNAGQRVTLSIKYMGKAPSVSISPLSAMIQTAVTAANQYSRVIVLANDVGREGADRATLELPYGADAVIRAVAAVKPVGVALFTTGPVTMPWLSNVDGVFEMWNGAGDATADGAISKLVPAISDLLDGTATPTGHLPVTFPATTAQSPAGISNQSFWPGFNATVHLDAAPLSGLSIGFDWYQRAGYPVLFPFGFGLTYPTTSVAFGAGSLSCAPATAISLCLNVQPKASLLNSTNSFTSVAQLYLAPPANSGQPTLMLAGVAAGRCRSVANGVTTNYNTCSTNPTPVTITATGSGTWNATSSRYEFVAGCYSFIVASHARDAYEVLATPNRSDHLGRIVHATAPFSSSTTFSAGSC